MYRVPYAGFIGDYQSIQVLVPTANGFPWLAKLTGASYFNQPAGASYSMVGDDIPFFLHPPRPPVGAHGAGGLDNTDRQADTRQHQH